MPRTWDARTAGDHQSLHSCRGSLHSPELSTKVNGVTDPDELRARAASIFQQLRVEEHSRSAEPQTDDWPDTSNGEVSDEGAPAHEEEPASPAATSTPDASDAPESARPLDAPFDLAGSDGSGEPPEPTRLSELFALRAPWTRPSEQPSPPTGEDRPGLSDSAPVWSSDDAPPPVGQTDAEAATARPLRPSHPGAGRPLPRIMAIANQKGGVGKTTTAVNLGAALAEINHRVLVVDLDPQGNATTGLGINARSLESSIYDVILHDVPAEDVIEPTTLRNLFVMPATIDLAGAEIELVPVFSRELRLRRALDSVQDDYDFVLIDCPPSLGLLTVNGLAAAGEVVVPIQCEYYALEGLSQLLRNVDMVRSNLNATLELSTIILTMYDARTRLAEQVVKEVREHFGERVCRNVVPRTVRLSEAPSFGQPIIVFDSSSRGSIAYRELAKEVSGGTS